MKKLALVIVIMAAFGVLGCAATSALTTTPLPKTILIIPPDPSVGQIAEYSGIWTGVWANDLLVPTTIALEKIDKKEVIAVYSWGTFENTPGGWIRVTGKVKNNSIVLEWGSGQHKTVLILNLVNKNIQAEYRREGRLTRATLMKVSAPAPKSP